jgi:hypothetical protein
MKSLIVGFSFSLYRSKAEAQQWKLIRSDEVNYRGLPDM